MKIKEIELTISANPMPEPVEVAAAPAVKPLKLSGNMLEIPLNKDGEAVVEPTE